PEESLPGSGHPCRSGAVPRRRRQTLLSVAPPRPPPEPSSEKTLVLFRSFQEPLSWLASWFPGDRDATLANRCLTTSTAFHQGSQSSSVRWRRRRLHLLLQPRKTSR